MRLAEDRFDDLQVLTGEIGSSAIDLRPELLPGNPVQSRWLLKPLHPDGGGSYTHNGVRRWESRDDPEWQMMAAWVRGERAGLVELVLLFEPKAPFLILLMPLMIVIGYVFLYFGFPIFFGDNPDFFKGTVVEQAVASELGNTPTIARQAYIHPAVFEQYERHGQTIEPLMRKQARAVRSEEPVEYYPEEAALMRFLERYG